MLVKVEMSEAILLALKTWDQKPQDGRIKNKQKQKQSEMSSRILNSGPCSLNYPSGTTSFQANYSVPAWFLYCVFARLLAWSFFSFCFSSFLSPRAQLDFDPCLQHLPLILFGSWLPFHGKPLMNICIPSYLSWWLPGSFLATSNQFQDMLTKRRMASLIINSLHLGDCNELSLWKNLNFKKHFLGWLDGREAQEGWHIFILIADIHCCASEANTTL